MRGVPEFSQSVREQASVEIGPPKPALVPTEDLLDFPFWTGGFFHQTVKLVLEPLGTIFQYLDDQTILVREMTVHRHLGHVGLGDDPVNARGVKARALEQRISGFDDVLALVRASARW